MNIEIESIKTLTDTEANTVSPIRQLEGMVSPQAINTIIDLFCKAGGSATGLHRAFPSARIIGVDKDFQKNYPFEFIQADAMTYPLNEADLVWASVPCQKYSRLTVIHKKTYPDLLTPTRKRLRESGKYYIIENVPGAPLENPVVLCGTMFGLRVLRHRLFETYPRIDFPPFTCNHWGKTYVRSNKRKAVVAQRFSLAPFLTVTGHDFIVADAKIAMGIDWMTAAELAEAIPPAYSQWIGEKIKMQIAVGLTG
jgi:DNA (cytosine-5)-methyltransferase 1